MTTASAPPKLAGLTFIEPIGTGGFADVYLYQQSLPSRRVAVKVLREGTDQSGMEQFHAEANVMAQLSSHPSIVPIYQADVSADGRAYLVMEYCPPPHLAQRFRAERIAVPEVLDIAVKISSAVETAHRAGILHRDIKPHNILTSAFGAPLLTDFGIASAAGESEGTSYGMSVPWSPPEAFEEQAPLDVRSDVFSLAATVYSLLAGRSPFEIPGGANDNATLMHRIENQTPSLILRADVPEALNQLLQRAMSKRLQDRPASAMALARDIQEIQVSLGLAPTRLEVMDASPGRGADAAVVEDSRTEVKPISIIIPDAIVERGTMLRPRLITQVDDRTGIHPARRTPEPDTVHKRAPVAVRHDSAETAFAPQVEADETEPMQARSSRLPLVAGVAALAVIVGVVALALSFGDDPADTPTAGPEPSPSRSMAVSAGPGTPANVRFTPAGEGRVTVRWTNPDPEPGDIFYVQAGGSLDELGTARRTPTPRITARTGRSGLFCVRVAVVRDEVAGPAYQNCEVVK